MHGRGKEMLEGFGEGKRLHRKPRHRWDGIKMVLREISRKSVEWIHVVEDTDQ
jgi:hypothetical protein